MRARLNECLCLDDFERAARSALPEPAYEFIAAGAGDEHTIRWNREAWNSIRLRQRVLAGIERADTTLTLLGQTLAHPILLAPAAYLRAVHPEGECAAAKGAEAAGSLYVISTSSTTRLSEIARAANGPRWFQVYLQPDRDFTARIIREAEEAGCSALCLTVDAPVLGARNRQQRAGFCLPPGVDAPYQQLLAARSSPTDQPRRQPVSWGDLRWLAAQTRLPVLAKGVLDPDDAARALDEGAAGIVVSNHGGRNLDTLPATADALPAIARRVGGRAPVLVDGGIRRGTDVLKALALGASATLIGRPYVYALGLAGAEGVTRAVSILADELEAAMVLCGLPRLGSVSQDAIWQESALPPTVPASREP